MKTPETPQEIHETLYDGVDREVILNDGSKRMVKIRKISRRKFSEFASAFGDEEREAAYYLGEDRELVNQLSDESFDLVMKEGQRLNFTRFSSWFERQSQRLEIMGETGAIKAALAMMEDSPALKHLLPSTKN